MIAQDQIKQGRGFLLNRFYLFKNDERCEMTCPSNTSLIEKTGIDYFARNKSTISFFDSF